MKISDTPLPPFLQHPLFYQPISFYEKHLKPPFFENFKNSTPPFLKGRCSNYEQVLWILELLKLPKKKVKCSWQQNKVLILFQVPWKYDLKYPWKHNLKKYHGYNFNITLKRNPKSNKAKFTYPWPFSTFHRFSLFLFLSWNPSLI